MQHAIFQEFVDICFEGVQSRAAEALQIDRSMVSRLCSGERGVTPELALRVEELSGGRFRKEALIWPEGRAA